MNYDTNLAEISFYRYKINFENFINSVVLDKSIWGMAEFFKFWFACLWVRFIGV